MAAQQKARYLGTTDRSKNEAGSVEIDGVTLEQDKLVEGLSAEQIKRLEDLPYHRFAFGADAEKDEEAEA